MNSFPDDIGDDDSTPVVSPALDAAIDELARLAPDDAAVDRLVSRAAAIERSPAVAVRGAWLSWGFAIAASTIAAVILAWVVLGTSGRLMLSQGLAERLALAPRGAARRVV